MHRAMKTCGGTHLSSICLPHLHQVVIQSRFCLSPCSCSHSYPLFTSLYLSLFCVSRPQSSSQKSSQRSHGNQSPLFGSAERVHECLTNIPPQKCHLSASERGRQCLKSWPEKRLGNHASVGQMLSPGAVRADWRRFWLQIRSNRST